MRLIVLSMTWMRGYTKGWKAAWREGCVTMYVQRRKQLTNCQLYTEWILLIIFHLQINILCLGHRSHGITDVDCKLTNINKGMLIGSHSIHGIQLSHTVAHDNKGLVCQLVVILTILHKRQVNALFIIQNAIIYA